MTNLNELYKKIDTLLNLPGTGSYLHLNSNTLERAYEAYVLGLCMEAVRNAGGQVRFRGINTGNSPKTIIFRGAPGSMSTKTQDFSYVHCNLGREQFEIHVDVEYEGHSKATHEIDVSLTDYYHCENVRRIGKGRSPRTNKLIALFECKFYQSRTVGIGPARAFVGLKSDCTQFQLCGFVSNSSTQNLKNYLSRKNSPEPYTPIPSKQTHEALFVRDLEQALRKWAKI